MSDAKPDPSIAAAEYALGLTSADEWAEADRRFSVDPAFRREVEAWREDLAAFIHEVPAAPVPGTAWAKLQNRLATTRPGIGPQSGRKPRAAWWLLAAGLVIGAVFGAGVVALTPRTPDRVTSAPSMPQGGDAAEPAVAVLSPESGSTPFVVMARMGEARLTVVPTSPWTVRGTVPCLWGVDGDADPVFLARLSLEEPVQVVVPDAHGKLVSAGVVFVVTAETPDWDPKVASRGVIVGHGKLQRVASVAKPSW